MGTVMELTEFLKTSYTAYHAVENAVTMLEGHGFLRLSEGENWHLEDGKGYFAVRGGSSLIAFRYQRGGAYRLIASHTDSPCFKLKANPALSDANYTRLNAEPYGGGLWYTFFDRPLRLAGRVVRERDGKLVSETYTSGFQVVLPSLAIHQHRDANEKFAPNLQTELPLLSIGKCDFEGVIADMVSSDLFAMPAEEPFVSGYGGEFLSSPRIDNLVSVYTSLSALIGTEHPSETLVCACFDSEEIGSRTLQGAGGDFLKTALTRIGIAQGRGEEERLSAYARSLLLSLDNAHALHPNHPETCDPTNRPVLGGGIVIKGHAGGAYTSDALTTALLKKILGDAGVKYQTFFNRSDVRSGSTLGAISLGQVSIPSVDAGLAQLAMHSAVETMAYADYEELLRGLCAFYISPLSMDTAV